MERKIVKFRPDEQTMFSGRQFSEHYKLYEKYFVNATKALEDRQYFDVMSYGSDFEAYKNKETFDINGARFHQMFFEQFVDIEGVTEKQSAYDAKVFDGQMGYAIWADSVRKCLKFATGWIILGYDVHDKVFRNIVMRTHNDGLPTMFIPLLVLDMYEHAYFIDFGTNKQEYVEKTIASINWNCIKQRMEQYKEIPETVVF